MNKLAIDTETHPIAPGRAAPKLVCTTWATSKTTYGIMKRKKSRKFWKRILRDRNTTIANITLHFDMAVVCATFPELTDDVFAAYEAGRMRCGVVDQREIDIANGCLGRVGGKKMRYSLAAQMKRHFDVDRAKGADTWRVRYNELEDVPLKDWPYDATKYAIRDAIDALMVSDVHDESANLLRDNTLQAYASFALYLMSCRGIRTNGVKCEALIKATEKELKRCKKICREHKLLTPEGKKSLKLARARLVAALPEATRERLADAIRAIKSYNAKREKQSREQVQVRHGLTDKEFAKAQRKLDKLLLRDIDHQELLRRWQWSNKLYRDMRSLVRKPRPFSALGVSLTKTGLVSVSADACRLSQDPVLVAYATATSANSLLKKSQRMLRGAYIPLQTTYESPIASGRTSSRASDAPLVGDNFQNFRRGATQLEKASDIELPGQRECIEPREGFTFCSIDLPAAEMRGYAQLEFEHLGDSELGRTLNAGMNPHHALAADILGMSYEKFERRYAAGNELCVRTAQFAKIPNFALLGGGGWRILPDYARGMGLTIDDEFAQQLYDAFHSRWKTVKEMHKYYKTFIHKRYEHPYSRRLRYIDRYAQACNNPFQGLIADAIKWALCQLAKEEYTTRGVLRGSYSVLFLHDEVLFELTNKYRSEHAWRAATIINKSVNRYLSRCPLTAKPALMSFFSKEAKTVTHPTKKDRDGNPLLLVWDEERKAA